MRKEQIVQGKRIVCSRTGENTGKKFNIAEVEGKWGQVCGRCEMTGHEPECTEGSHPEGHSPSC